MGVCDTARASCRIKNTHILLSYHLLRYCKSTKYHNSYFAGWQAAVQGPTSPMVRGFASQAICKTSSQHFPTEHMKKVPAPRETTGSMETSSGGAGRLPEGKAAGTKQGVLWKQGGSVLPVLLAFSPKLPALPACMFLGVMIAFSPC